ncbi:hypothetical protein LJC56_11540 [Christensenellaceae bacterium OttesenSCG-928-K19]|nr:hypothetical protein [Christensenellaceae bacterium OttesenSCG-928-K19]
MKRKTVCLLIASMLLCFCVAGCSAPFLNTGGQNLTPTTSEKIGEGTPLFEYLDDPQILLFAENFEDNVPVSISVLYQTEAGGEPYTVTDEETIRSVFEALQSMMVLGEAGSGHTDDYLNYYFEMADGTIIGGFEFQGGMYLDSRMGLHEVTGFAQLQATLSYPYTGTTEENLYYENDTLGFSLTLPPGWQPNDTGHDEIGGTIEFIPDSSLYGTSDSFLSVTFLSGVSLEDAIEKSDGFVDGGTILQEGEAQIGGAQAYGVVYGETTQDGTAYSTCLYMVDDGGDNCYYLYYTVANDLAALDSFAVDVEGIIVTFAPRERTLVDQTPPPEETPAPEQTLPAETMDFLDLYGANTSEDVVAALGEPDDIADEGTDYPSMTYEYIDLGTMVGFEMNDDGEYMINYIGINSAASPFTVGGISCGMEFHEAEAALESYGFAHMPGLTDEHTGRFYQEPEGDDPYSPVIMFQTDTNANVIVVVGYWSKSAQWALEDYAIRVGG